MKALLPRRLGARLMAGATLQVLLISTAVGALAYWSGRHSGLEHAKLERQQDRITRQLTPVALLVSLLAIALALQISGSFTRWLLEPLLELRRRVLQTIPEVESSPGRIQFTPQLAAGSAIEIEQLAQAVGELVQQLNAQNAALLRREERLEAKLRSSLHAAAVAHEINLPLSTLLLNARLLVERSGDQLGDAERQRLEALGHDAQQVVDTIEKMRTLLRNVQTDRQPTDLAEVVRSALVQMRAPLRQAAVDVVRDPSLEQPLSMQGDPAQIQISVVNLLRNAIEALNQPPATAAPRIGLHLERCIGGDGEAVIDLIVDDNGPGFPEGLEAVTPLDTTKPQGSGLGLFVVETTMANHGGEVALERSPWGGARVRLRFPAS